MTADELAKLLADMPPEQFQRLVLAAPSLAAEKAPETDKPPVARYTIYIPPHGERLEVWSVDRRPWLKAGAVEHPPTAEDLERWNPKPVKAVAPPLPPPAAAPDPVADEPDDEPTLKELRAAWREANPGKPTPPRAKRDWYMERLTSPEKPED